VRRGGQVLNWLVVAVVLVCLLIRLIVVFRTVVDLPLIVVLPFVLLSLRVVVVGLDTVCRLTRLSTLFPVVVVVVPVAVGEVVLPLTPRVSRTGRPDSAGSGRHHIGHQLLVHALPGVLSHDRVHVGASHDANEATQYGVGVFA
jgi:hypothetical protein